MIQSLATIAGGGPFGRGLGHGLQKFGYLPEDTTDFVFAIICEELGIAGAALVASLYVLLVGTVLAVARRTRTRALQLIAVGVGRPSRCRRRSISSW
jgi:cell division protein FtsW